MATRPGSAKKHKQKEKAPPFAAPLISGFGLKGRIGFLPGTIRDRAGAGRQAALPGQGAGRALSLAYSLAPLGDLHRAAFPAALLPAASRSGEGTAPPAACGPAGPSVQSARAGPPSTASSQPCACMRVCISACPHPCTAAHTQPHVDTATPPHCTRRLPLCTVRVMPRGTPHPST